jgi:hypothetical protein
VAKEHPEIVNKIKEVMTEAHVANPDWQPLAGEFVKKK